MKILKVKKTFNYEGLELRIVDREEPHTDNTIMIRTRVIAPNGGMIPVQLQSKQTMKNIVNATVKFLDNMKKLGADIVDELTKEI